MKIDLERILLQLSERRTIFHSEADFQHELAHEIRCVHPDLRYRLEWPRPRKDELKGPKTNRGAIDIAVLEKSGSPKLFLELKYKTQYLNRTVDGENFLLANHGAGDWGQYDIIKDLCHVEFLKKLYPAATCAVITLTNSTTYWNTAPRSNSAYKKFSLHNGRRLSGTLEWQFEGSEEDRAQKLSNQKSRAEPLRLSGTYDVMWKSYSPELKFLILEAENT
jgi:hypothetical protein